MANDTSDSAPTPPLIAPSTAIPLLEEQLAKLKKIAKKRPINKQAYLSWESFNHDLLIKAFGKASRSVSAVFFPNWDGLRLQIESQSEENIDQSRAERIVTQITQMKTNIEKLKLESKLQPKDKLQEDRASLMGDVHLEFSNNATLLDAEQFAIDHQDKIKAFDSLLRDGTLDYNGGKLKFSLRSYVESRFWQRDEDLLNRLLPVMKEMYSEKKTGHFEVSDFIARIKKKEVMIKVRPIEIERALRLFERMSLLGGHNPITENGVERIKNFNISSMILRSDEIADQLEHYTQSARTISAAMTIGAGLTAPAGGLAVDNKKVFIVHGHNEAAKQTVARTLEKIGLLPIILHEQANQGRTLIEKFEKNADVGFAVVIVTADDLGKAKAETKLGARARQNVVFEWGFFVGKLGRQRVCALYEEGIKSPSDMDGLVYTALDKAGHWCFALGKELKAAGYDVDLNKLS